MTSPPYTPEPPTQTLQRHPHLQNTHTRSKTQQHSCQPNVNKQPALQRATPGAPRYKSPLVWWWLYEGGQLINTTPRHLLLKCGVLYPSLTTIANISLSVCLLLTHSHHYSTNQMFIIGNSSQIFFFSRVISVSSVVLSPSSCFLLTHSLFRLNH